MTVRILAVAALFAALLPASATEAQMAFVRSTQPNGELGHAISEAGDVNNDGFADILVGAPRDDVPGLDDGRAFLWFGGPGLRIAPDLIFDDGNGSEAWFGYAVAGIGDINGDNFDDIAIGAPQDDTAGADAGAVYIYYGGASMDATWDVRLTGETGDDNFGWALSRAGDMNGDLRPDFVVGAPNADPPAGTDAGSVYLYAGASGTPSSTPLVEFEGTLANAHFGWSVSDVPDFRGNGVASVLVGAPGYQSDTGRAYLFYGANGTPNTGVDVTFTHNISGEEFGWAVSHAGEFNSDSFIDIAIGAPGHQGDRGFVRIYYGESSPSSTPTSDLQILGETAGDRFGAAVADVGNFNGVGQDDLAVGAPLRDGGASVSGQVYLFPGGSSYTSASQGTDILADNPQGAPANDRFGTSLSALDDDLDGDGDPDFLIGAPFGNNGAGTVSGIGVVMGSGTGVIPVAEIPVVVQRSGIVIEMRFGGIAAEASEATLWTVEASPRLLGRLGREILAVAGELVAAVPVQDVAGVTEAELRFVRDGVTLNRTFDLPITPVVPTTLAAPWPNPFNPSTTVSFSVPAGVAYDLRVFDAQGRMVRFLESFVSTGERRTVRFDGLDDRGFGLASGVYRVVLVTEHERLARSMVLMK